MTANISICLKLYCTWNNLSKVWSDCNKKLEESLQMALQYQDTMQVCPNGAHESHLLTVSRALIPSCEQENSNSVPGSF